MGNAWSENEAWAQDADREKRLAEKRRWNALVYVAGPYRADSESRVWRNIQAARDVAIWIWEAGAVAICPHLNTMLMGGVLPDAVWLQGDLAILSRCDAVVVTPGWSQSSGAKAEVAAAVADGLPVFRSQFAEDMGLGLPNVVDNFDAWLDRRDRVGGSPNGATS